MNQNRFHYGMINSSGYNPNYVVNLKYLNLTPPINPSDLLVYGPYQEGPSSQMIPPDWFGYYAYANPNINPSYIPNFTYYMNPQFLPRIR